MGKEKNTQTFFSQPKLGKRKQEETKEEDEQPPKKKQKKGPAQKYFEEGEKAYKEKQYSEAISHYEKAYQEAPIDNANFLAKITYRLGEAHYHNKGHNNALGWYIEAWKRISPVLITEQNSDLYYKIRSRLNELDKPNNQCPSCTTL